MNQILENFRTKTPTVDKNQENIPLKPKTKQEIPKTSYESISKESNSYQ